ncbi:MAG: zinc ribbon domain-containing protein [Defluviitaleaceae bacterium]|nr:zinc ribbon domain-containing protein [Defluviitaleaceae bacterium]
MSDFRETVTSAAKSVAKTSGDFLKTTKLNMNLSSEENALKALYLEIGKKVHEIYKYGGSVGEFFDEKYTELQACEKKIAEIKEQISVIKGIRKCPDCGKTAERLAEFCPKCGKRFDGEAAFLSAQPEASMPEEINFAPSEIPRQQPQAARMDIPRQQPQPQAAHMPEIPAFSPPVPAMPEKVCRVCGAKNEISTKFCLSCGRIVD